MKFTVELRALVKMIETVGKKMPAQKRCEPTLRLFACEARVFVECNQTVAGIEALVLNDGQCTLARMKFLRILKTYRGRKNLTIEAQPNRLSIGSFSMNASNYSPQAQAPGKFLVFPVADLSELLPDSQPSTTGTKELPAKSTPIAEPPQETRLNQLAAQEVAENPPLFDSATEAALGEILKPPVALAWDFFPAETLDTLFLVYTHKNELDWAEKMWIVLGKHGLTTYSTAEEYNRALIRLAVLARYFKCWAWKAYDDAGDPYYEYDTWFDALPLVRSSLPTLDEEKPADDGDVRNLLARLIESENDAVFEAVINSCGDHEEIQLALNLRHAAGVGDEFGCHVRFDGSVNDLEAQEKFFNEYGLSMREFDCLHIINNRFNF